MDPYWGTLLGKLLSAVFGAAFVLLGLKAFSKDGLPVTRSMRLSGLGGILVGLILISVGAWWIQTTFFSDNPTTPKPAPATRLTGTPGPKTHAYAAQPRPYRFPTGNCLITSPVPLLDKSPHGFINGAKVHLYTGADPLSRNIFVLSFVDPPFGTVPNVAAEATDMITGAGLSPEGSSELVFADHYQACQVNGSGLVAEVPVHAVSRCILVRNRLYLLMVQGPADDLTDVTAPTFLDSFQLIADPAAN